LQLFLFLAEKVGIHVKVLQGLATGDLGIMEDRLQGGVEGIVGRLVDREIAPNGLVKG